MSEEWLLWQLADSAFPSGSFAHSSGLEAAWQHGLVNDSAALISFLVNNQVQTRRGVLQFVRQSWRNPLDHHSINLDCNLFLNNHIANSASRAQGAALLSVSNNVFKSPTIRDFVAATRKERGHCHGSVAFGMVTQALNLSEEKASSLFLFMMLRGCVSAAVRLGIVGPLEAQRIQSGFANSPQTDPAAVVWQTSPVMDLLQGTQERLYSRLFQS